MQGKKAPMNPLFVLMVDGRGEGFYSRDDLEDKIENLKDDGEIHEGTDVEVYGVHKLKVEVETRPTIRIEWPKERRPRDEKKVVKPEIAVAPPKDEEFRRVPFTRYSALSLATLVIRHLRSRCPLTLQSFCGRTDVSNLVRCDLILRGSNGRPGNRGWYKPTQQGIDWVYGRIFAPAYLKMKGKTVIGMSDERVKIGDLLDEKTLKTMHRYLNTKGNALGWKRHVEKIEGKHGGKSMMPTDEVWLLPLKTDKEPKK